MVHFANLKLFFFFGGGNFHKFFNDLFIYDIENKSWQLPEISGVPPTPRASHTATKIDDTHFCVIGGGEPSNVFNDFYLFDIEKTNWIRINTAG